MRNCSAMRAHCMSGAAGPMTSGENSGTSPYSGGRRLILRRRSISRQATVSTIAIVVAAGRGSRVGDAADGPKQYADLGGIAMLTRTLEALANHDEIDRLLVVIHPDDTDPISRLPRASIGAKLMPPVHGGATRQQSVRLGLEALARLAPPHAPQRVLIHDAARPFLAPALIDRVLAALASSPAALPGLAVADTLKRVDGRGTVAGTVDRTGLWRAQTPQGFHYRCDPRGASGGKRGRAQRIHRRFDACGVARHALRARRGRRTQHQDHHRGGTGLGATAQRDGPGLRSPMSATAPASTSTASAPATKSGYAASRCRIRTRSRAIPMPMSDCTR